MENEERIENSTSKSKKKEKKVKRESKKEKKVKKEKKDISKVKKAEKKRKRSPEDSEIQSENGAKRAKTEESSTVTKEIKITEDDEHEPVTNYRVSPQSVKILEENGYKTLFPIQSRTFDFVYDGRDVIGRARTGTGKTLSFVLPILEKIHAENKSLSVGRGPMVLILAPTRELARQVESVVTMLARKLVSICIYGGVQYDRQESMLYRGVDIVVGTPGRLIDHLDRGNLKLTNLKYFVCDEADEMLNMGFREDVEKIVSNIPKENNIQTLLYSATIPDWVRVLAKTYLKDHIIVDLVSTDKLKTQAAVGVSHLAMHTQWAERFKCLNDIIKLYGKGGKTIVFTDTKHEANEVGLSSSVSSICQVLHGDIAQNQREVTLASFRDGLFQVLVATDVAARGLDIEGVDLIIQCSPPKDYEQYIHRSGRTGRAGKAGTSITLCTPRSASILKNIEKQGNLKFTRVGIPQPKDLYIAAGEAAAKEIIEVDLDVLPHFLPFAKEIIEHFEGNSEHAVAAALSVITGFTKKMSTRSLLSNTPGYVTVLIKHRKGQKIQTASFVVNMIMGEVPDEDSKKIQIKNVKLCKDGSAVADINEGYVQKVVQANESRGEVRNICISVLSEVPDLKEEYAFSDFRRGGNGARGRRGGNGASFHRGRGGHGANGKARGGHGASFGRRKFVNAR